MTYSIKSQPFIENRCKWYYFASWRHSNSFMHETSIRSNML